MQKKKVQFMCTAFRDGFQSVFGARVQTKDFLPAVEAAKNAGITYFEAGGGARFQSLYFYCQEDAFDMMDQFRATAGPDANLQTLARGVNVVGLDSQSSDIIDLHAKMFKKHGMTTIRNFDALNDVNNLIYSGQAITNAGLKHQVCVTLMALPPGCEGAHTPEFYEKTLRDILDAEVPYDSVCFKDASGTATPRVVYETIKRARKMLPEGTAISYHTHDTAGTAVACNLAALDAGADLIDLSMKPCSGGTCQPDILTMWHALRGTEYELDVDIDKVLKAEDVFVDCMKDYFLPPEATAVEPLIPWSPMPGGALTANTQMMRDNNIMDRYPEVIKAMGEVVRKGGFGSSVTPVSQFYFQQAFNNVFFGPWKKIADSYGKMVLGYFGKTPVAPDAEVVQIAAEQLNLEPTTEKVLTLNDKDPNKGIAPAKKSLEDANLPVTDENIFIAAACKEKGIAFLKGEAPLGIRKKEAEAPKAAAGLCDVNLESARIVLTVNGKDYSINVGEGLMEGALIGGGPVYQGDKPMPVPNAKRNLVRIANSVTSQAMSKAKANAAANKKAADDDDVDNGSGEALTSPMPGKIWKVHKKAGDKVAKGDVVLVLEAMKMENEIKAPKAGTVTEVLVKEGEAVDGNAVLARIGE